MIMHIADTMIGKLPPQEQQRLAPHPTVPGIFQLAIMHHAYLYNVIADTPARVRIMNWAWYTGKAGACGWCCTPGHVAGGSTVRYAGYASKLAVLQAWRGDRKPRQLHAWDARMRLTPEDMAARTSPDNHSIPGVSLCPWLNSSHVPCSCTCLLSDVLDSGFSNAIS